MRLDEAPTVAALVPVKFGSLRLRKKNFQQIGNHARAPTMWEATEDILKAHKAIKKIWFSVDSYYAYTRLKGRDILIEGEQAAKTVGRPFTECFACHRQEPASHVMQGRTLGGSLANLTTFLYDRGLLDYDYLLVPQVDCWPKCLSQIDQLLDYARLNPDVDFVVSAVRGVNGKGLVQIGAWRMIRLPLNLEPLGQTVGMVEIEGRIHDIHTPEQLVELQQFYDKMWEESEARPGPHSPDEKWWVLP